jgi:hypothetical protein
MKKREYFGNFQSIFFMKKEEKYSHVAKKVEKNTSSDVYINLGSCSVNSDI